MDRPTSDGSSKRFTVIGLIIAALAVVTIGYILDRPDKPHYSGISKPASETPSAETAERPLQASGGCQAGRVVVANESSELWLDPKIEINGVFVFVGDAIAPKTTLRYFPSIFTRSDGTRLNLDDVACLRMDIHATVDGKRRHWNGASKGGERR